METSEKTNQPPKTITQGLLRSRANNETFPNVFQIVLTFLELDSMEGIESVFNCRTLNISHNKIKKITSLKDIVDLRELNISGNLLEKIDGLDTNKLLKELVVSYNRLTKMGNLNALSKLQILILDNNMLTSLNGIQGCKELKHLSVNNNRLTKLDCLSSLSKVEEIYAANNLIEAVHEADLLTNIKSLRDLDVSGNKITNLTFMNCLTELSRVNLSKNNIKDLRDVKEVLTNLQTIDLSNNGMTTLKGFGRAFPTVWRVDVSNNELMSGYELNFLEDNDYVSELYFAGNTFSMEGTERELFKKYKYLEIVNGIVFNQPGYRETCMIKEMRDELKNDGETNAVDSHGGKLLNGTNEALAEVLEDKDTGKSSKEAEKKGVRGDTDADLGTKVMAFMQENEKKVNEFRMKYDTLLQYSTFITKEEISEMKNDVMIQRGKSVNLSHTQSEPDIERDSENELGGRESINQSRGEISVLGTSNLSKDRTLNELKFRKGKPMFAIGNDKLGKKLSATSVFDREDIQLSATLKKTTDETPKDSFMEPDGMKQSLPRISYKDPGSDRTRVKLPVIKSAARTKAASLPKAPLPKAPSSSHETRKFMGGITTMNGVDNLGGTGVLETKVESAKGGHSKITYDKMNSITMSASRSKNSRSGKGDGMF